MSQLLARQGRQGALGFASLATVRSILRRLFWDAVARAPSARCHTCRTCGMGAGGAGPARAAHLQPLPGLARPLWQGVLPGFRRGGAVSRQPSTRHRLRARPDRGAPDPPARGRLIRGLRHRAAEHPFVPGGRSPLGIRASGSSSRTSVTRSTTRLALRKRTPTLFPTRTASSTSPTGCVGVHPPAPRRDRALCLRGRPRAEAGRAGCWRAS